jgi:hypothetical protein
MLPETKGRTTPSTVQRALQLVALSAFAISQPTFDILGKNAAYFTAHRARPLQLVILVLIVLLAVPLGLLIIELLIGLASKRAADIAHQTFAGILAGLILAVPGEAIAGTTGWVVGFVIGAAAFVWLYRKNPRFPTLLAWLSAAALIFVGLFLFGTPVKNTLMPASVEPLANTGGNGTPVVMLIMDEMPLSPLLVDDGKVGTFDAKRFPNLARFENDATWYRYATTNGESTQRALPALLTGTYAKDRSVPDINDYPDNVFTLLAGSYDIEATEFLTLMCPKECAPDRSSDADNGTDLLVKDTSIIAGHIVLPGPLAKKALPALGATWRGFGSAGKPTDVGLPGETKVERKARMNRTVNVDKLEGTARTDDFDRMLAKLDPSPRNAFWYTHFAMPHRPWRYLPNGQAYTDTNVDPGVDDLGGWTQNEHATQHGLQRYLLQVKYADAFLGRLIDSLEKTKTYDESLVIMLADHGLSFIPGTSLRKVEPRTVGDIAPVPLMIKYPKQKTGKIDTGFTELIDVVPTIADVLDVHMPWRTVGHSLLGRERDRARHQIATMPLGVQNYPPEVPRRDRLMRIAHALFGSGSDDPDDLYGWGAHRIVGDDASSKTSGGVVGSVVLDDALSYDDVTLDADKVPAWVTGRLQGVDNDTQIAVALNGRIAGTGWTYAGGGGTRFAVIASPRYLKAGDNEVRLYVIRDDGSLQPIRPSR